MRERPTQAQSYEAGLKTVDIIKTKHPGVPVIIYSDYYGRQHRDENPMPPVVLATNVTRDVFTKVVSIASGTK
jgi:hypothetical protein